MIILAWLDTVFIVPAYRLKKGGAVAAYVKSKFDATVVQLFVVLLPL